MQMLAEIAACVPWDTRTEKMNITIARESSGDGATHDPFEGRKLLVKSRFNLRFNKGIGAWLRVPLDSVKNI